MARAKEFIKLDITYQLRAVKLAQRKAPQKSILEIVEMLTKINPIVSIWSDNRICFPYNNGLI